MKPEFLPGNAVTLLETGDAYFPALEAAIDGAKSEIHLECYIFEADAAGRRIGDALMRAAARDVVVRVMIDGFGSQDLPPVFRRELYAAGVQLLVYRSRISPWTLRKQRLRRLHRKICVVDAEIAFVGGINIIDDRDGSGERQPRFDYAVRIQGPLLLPICYVVRRLWSRVARLSLRQRRHPTMPPVPVAAACGKVNAAFLQRDNIAHRRDIEDAYMSALENAASEVIIANAYFFPGRKFRQALHAAAERGVRVVLLMQGQIEYMLLYYATRALYGNFLEAGIEIFEYHGSYLHAKVAVVDGRWATVGSSNIDPFSLLLAREANVMVEDAEFAGELRAGLMNAIETRSARMEKKHWDSEPLSRRVAVWICYGIARVLIGAVGYAGWH
jgi:cardiolipin synthase A/B